MAKGFNLTATINLQGPSNIKQVVNNINKQLGSISANVNLNISTNTVQSIAKVNKNLQTLNQTLGVTTQSATTATQAFNNLAAAMASVGKVNLPTNISAPINNITSSVTSASKVLGQTRTEFEDFGRQAGLAVRRFAAFSTVTSVIYSFSNAMSKGIQQYIEFDKQVTRLSQVTNESKASLGSLVGEITRLSTGLGVASEDLATVSVTLAQAGFTAQDTRRALEALAKSALAPSFDNLNQTVEGSIALMRQFGISAIELEGALGSVNAVAAAFAVEASDIIAAIQRTGGVFASASKGVSEGTDALNEFIAVFTSIRATTRESAETIATGLRTIFTRIQRADTVEALKEYGVVLTDLEGKFVGPYEAVRRLSEGLNSLDPRNLKFSQIIEELGGFRQIGKVLPLIQQFAVAQDALRVAQEGQGSLATDAAKGQLALAVQIQQVREEFSALVRSIGDGKGFQTLVRLGLDLAGALIKVADATKGVLPLIGIMAAFRGISAVTQFAGGFGGGLTGGKNKKAQGGFIHRFAEGGSVPGVGNRDSVPAMLTPGEFVMNKNAVRSVGRNNLQKLNLGGSTKRVPIKTLASRSDNGASIKSFKNQSENFIENDDTVSANIRKKTFEDYGFEDKDYPIITSRLKRAGVKFPIGSKTGSSRGKFDARSGPIMEDLLIERMGKGAKKYEGVGGYSDISNAPIDIVKGKSIYEVKFKSGSTSDNEILGKFLRYKLEKTPYKSIGFQENKLGKKSIDNINLGSINLIHGSDMDDVSGYKSDYISWLKKQNSYQLKLGGKAQKFAEGGVAQRKVGYIDYDVIANEANKAIVEKGMKETGSDGPRIYSDYLTKLAVNARKSSNIQKLRAIYGVAGSGKTTLARGQGTDSAKLRQTERFPILSPEDIQKATEILILTSSVSKTKMDDFFGDVDRAYTLSSTTSAERSRVKDQRGSRDATGIGLEGRQPGTTMGVSTDTAVGEALLSDKLGDKSVVLGRSGSGRLRRKSGNELVDIIKKRIGFTWGGFAPTTAGHESIMDAAAAMGIPPEDFIALVGANEAVDPSSYRTAIFDQDARVLLAKAGFGARGATVLPKPRDFDIPQGFDITQQGSDRRQVLIPGKGSTTFVGDKTEEQTAKYKQAGYDVKSIERTGGISGTMVRDLIIAGDMAKLQSVLSPGVYDLVSNNIGRIQNRASVLPSLIEQAQKEAQAEMSQVDQAIEDLGIKRIDSKKIESDPEYAAKVEVLKELRTKKQKMKSAAGFTPYKLLDALAQKDPQNYALDFTVPATMGNVPTMRVMGQNSQTPEAPTPVGRVAQLAQEKNKSIQDVILEQLGGLGGPAGVKRILGIGSGDRTLSSLLQAGNIKSGKGLEQAADYVNKALAVKGINDAAGAKRLEEYQAKAMHFGIAGLLPIDYSKEFEWNVGGTDIYATARGFGSMYLEEARQMQKESSALAQKFAENVQNKSIFGGGEKLAFDFDKTLVEDADILDAKGSPDIAKYSNRDAVQKALKNARPTRLATKLKSLIEEDPSFIKQTRILTARPQSTADLLAQSLQSFGLPYTIADITGVSSGLGSNIAALKTANLQKEEKLIDDNLDNIRAAKKAGKKGFQYVEPKSTTSELDEKMGQGNIEGAIVEKALAVLGAPVRPDAKQNRAIDYPDGLGSAAQFFPGIDPGIPTEVKRTIDGSSLEKVREEIGRYISGGAEAVKLAVGGVATKTRKPKEVFGTGETEFPSRISKKYAEEQHSASERLRAKLEWDKNPKDERIIIDDGQVKESFQQPFDRERFASSFQEKINRMEDNGKEEFLTTLIEKAPQLDQNLQGILDSTLTELLSGAGIQRQKYAAGRKVDYEAGVGASPFGVSVSKRLSQSIYNLQKGTGLSDSEFNEIKKTAETYGYNEEEFKEYLAKRIQEKKNKQGLRTDSSALLQQLIPQNRVSTPRQLALAETLKDTTNDIGYRPSALENIAQARTDINNARRFAVGGVAEPEQKKEKEYGKISITEDSGMISVGYLKSSKENSRQGHATASKLRDNLYYVGLSSATKGYGPRLYDVLMEAVTEKGAMLTSDRSSVSGDARKVWEYYFKNRGDVKKTPLEPKDWTQNEALLDPKLYGRKETWPPADDPAWVLQSGYSKTPNLINGPDVVRPSTKPDSRAMALSYFSARTPAFADGGSVPALVSNGEAYVPPKVAKRIGYGNLKRMNQADRNGMGRFSDGGISVFKGPGTGTSDSIPANLPVGSFIIREKATKALGFSNGGLAGARVQRFAFGGGPRGPAARPDTISLDTIGATGEAVAALQDVAAALTALGVSSSKSAQLLNRGYQATAAEATRAYEADLLMAKAAGASADILYDLETALAKTKKQAEAEVAIRKELGNVGGTDLQNTLSDIEDRIKSLTETAKAGAQSRGLSDEDVEKEVRAGAASRRNQAYEEVALSKGTDLAALGATGEDLERVINNLMRDSKTLEQMNRQYVNNRRAALAQEAAAAGDTAKAARIRAGAEQEIEQTIKDEIQARKNAIQEVADSNKSRGPNDREKMDRQNSMMLSFGVMTVGNIIANNISTKSDMTSAGVSGAVRGGTEAFSMTNQVISEMNNLASTLTSAGGKAAKFGNLLSKGLRFAPYIQAIAILGQAAIDAHNAMRQFTIDLEKSKVERALDGLGDKFEKLNKDLNQLNLRNEIKTNLIDASRSADRLRSATIDTATVGWVNAIDVLVTSLTDAGDGRLKRQSALRSQVLEKDGILEYLKINSGDTDAYNRASTKFAGEQATESSASFKPIADGINQLIQARARAGETADSMTSAPEFKDFAKSLVYADVALNKQIRQIELSTRYTEDEKKARIEEIISIEGANKIRMQAAIGQREAEQKSIGLLTSVYTRSLKRMFTNMEQAINAAAFSLKQMSDNVDLATAAITGQAKVGNIDLETSNVIQNPRAYSGGRVASAQASAGSLFGSRGPEMSKLMNLGETVESTVMSTINKTLENKGVDASNESIASAVDQSVRVELKNLGLPPELSDKLAKEVGSTLVDLRSSGEDKVDFAKLSERLGSLNSVIDTAKDAQQVAIKALENYQNVLNQYANNINKIIDLESSARERSRKSIQINSDANLELAKSLGRTIKLSDAFAKRDASVARQTGGLTAPDDIFQKILKLNTDRQVQQSSAKQAAEKGPAGVQDFVKFNSELSKTNLALRENRAALEEMANNTDKASAAMSAIQEAQQKAAGRVGFLEKVVTSTPEELESLNQSLYRLQRNMNGQQNTIQSSIGAQKAYRTSLEQGASAAEAMRAAQAAFSNERKETLGALQDILPFLGDSQQAGNIKANVLESMLQESGMGVSPLFQQVLNTLRNPDQDPATAAAMQYYQQAIGEQSRATALLGQLDTNLAQDIARLNSKLVVDGLTKATLTFENTELKDIANKVNTIISIMGRGVGAPPAGAGAPPAVGIATGGLVYASAGQLINFQPQGTDTVPAMLTPGEFVVNRKSTQANLPLLRSINSNKYNSGGSVGYYAGGGLITNWGKPDTMKDFDQISKKEIIDTSPGVGEKNSSLITDGYKKFTKIPPLYTLNFPSRSKSLPVGNSDPYSLDNIDLNSAKEVIFGVTPGIDLYGGKNYVSNFSEDLLREFESPTIIKDDKTLYLGKEALRATKVSKLQEAEIKEKLNKINIKNTALANFNPDAFSDGTDQPKISDFTAPTKDRFIPNLKQEKSPGISTDGLDPSINPVNETTPNYKPWLYNRSLYNPAYGYRTMAASVGPPEFLTGSPLGKDEYASKDFKITQAGDFGRYTKDPRPGMIPGKDIKKQKQTNKENMQIYLDTLDFMAGGAVYEKNGSGTALQDKLRSLFDNQASFITLTKPDLVPFDELKDATTAIIGQQSLENSFRKASEVSRGADSKIKFGLLGAPPAKAPADSILSKPFTITDDIVPPVSKSYPFMINGNIGDLGADFENKAKEELAKQKGKVYSKLITDNIKLTFPFDINGSKPTIDIPISYEEYTGELYDVAASKFDGNQFNTLLPNKIDTTLFEKLDTSSHRLFTPAKYTAADILSKSSLNDPAIQTQLADLIKMRTNNDPNVASQTAKVSAGLELIFNHPQNSLIKYPNVVGDGGADVFSGRSDEPTKVNIGEFVLKKLEEFRGKVAAGSEKVAQVPGLKKGAIFSDADLPVATSALIRGSMGLFGNLRLPGFPSGWLVKSGAARALRAAVSGNPAGAAGYMSGIFNQAGAFISQLQNRATTVPAYNALDNASTMISGAANAFASLAGGDTSLLKQFYEQKIQIADVFRSFGASAKFGKVAGMKLSPDWQNILGSQLSGTKIKTVGRDGSLTETDLAGAIPENANVNDLIKVLFNPYNEFPNKSTRADLIQKFGNDLFNLRGPNRMPYFDRQTLNWIGDGLTRLKKWYGGEGNWLGQDYFFDAAAEPDNAARMSNFLSSLKTDGKKYYKSAQEAQVLFGLANSFGPLPGEEWFTARGAVLPQNKATGGIIYAQNGGGPFVNFAPKGTDTVPAMLTPGEFVVNRSATQKNLPLLKAMNSGGNVGGYSRGGIVYLAGGSDDPVQTTVSGGPVGNIEGADIKGSVDEEIRRATAAKIEEAEKAKSINYKYGEYTVQRALSDPTAFPTEGYGLSSIRDYVGVIQDALKTKNYAGLAKLDTLPNQNINVDDLTQHLSTDPVTQEAINPYLADSTPWLWKFNLFSPDIASESRKTDESKEIQPDIRNLSPRLDAWSEVIQERLDPNKQKQKLAELEAYRKKLDSSGGRGTSPEKEVAGKKVREFKSKMTEWESKSGEYKKRLSSLQALISLRKIGGGTVKANEVAAMEAGESQEYNDARTLGLREDIIDEGVAEGTRKGLRNLVIGLAVGAAAPFFAPALAGAGIGAGLGTLLIGGAAGIGAIMGADAREAAQYEELKTLDPEEFARQQLLRNEGSYQAAQASTETLVDVADLVLSLGAGAATSQLAKKSRFFKFLDSGAETAGKKIFSRPSAASAKTQQFVEEAKKALNESNQTIVGKFPPEDISPKSAASAASDATTTPAVKSDDLGTTAVKPDADDLTPTVKPPEPDDIAPKPTVKSPDDAPSSASKMDAESPTIKLPKAMRLLVEEKLASFKAMVQEAQANRISQYVENIEKEASFRIQGMQDMVANSAPKNKAYNKAIADGVTDEGILTDILYKPYRDDLTKLSDDLRMKGWDVDLGPPLSANRNDDIISQIIERDMLGDDAWRQTRDAALNDVDNGLSKEGSDALRKAADDPNIKFEDRSWLDWSKQKTRGVLGGRNKYIAMAALAGIVAAMWPRNQPEGKPKEQPTDLAPTEDLAPGQPANGGIPVADALQVPSSPMVDAAANAAATKPQTVPNYYDELTYKEYVSRELAAGNPPPAPDKKLFTTAAFYAKDKNGSFRQTAYDRRASNIPQQVGDDKDPTKKSSIGRRNKESQMHTTTAAFAGAPMDVRDVTEDNKQAAISSGGFTSTGQFGTNQNTKEGNARIKDAIIPTQLQEAYGAEPMEGEDPATAENRAQTQSSRKITGRKGIESQYKSAYSFYRRKLGEYTYYNSVNYQNKDKFAQGKMKNRTETVARTLSSGGVVYASNGTLIPYVPRGTDTVPAMLTPGEFVVNARSAQKNLPLLHSINANKYAAGGRVSYLAGGTQETPEEKAARLQQIRKEKLAQRNTDLETKRAVETKRKEALEKLADDKRTAIEAARASDIAQRAAPAEQRKKAMEMSREKGISPQQAMASMNRREVPESLGGGYITGEARISSETAVRTASPQQQGVPQISPQTQQRVGMAAQAAFDPRNAGDMNKQLVIFGTLLTGVNQVITQFGAVMQQLVAGAGQAGGGVNNSGQGTPSTDGISQFTTTLNNFVNQLQKLNIPPEIKISISQTKPIDVNINGADALQQLLSGPLGEMITDRVKAALNQKDINDEKPPGS